ncbi:hypothetical protein ABIB95_009482, partial [Bradyrhizobium sp. LA2.1]
SRPRQKSVAMSMLRKSDPASAIAQKFMTQ